MPDSKRPPIRGTEDYVPEAPAEIVPHQPEGASDLGLTKADAAFLDTVRAVVVSVFDKLGEHASNEEKSRLATVKARELARVAERRHEAELAQLRHRVEIVLGVLIITGLLVIAIFALYRDKDQIVSDVLKIAMGALAGYGLGRVKGAERKRKRVE